MPIVTFDTCIFIKYKPPELPQGFRLTAVVLQELIAGANDESEVRYWNVIRNIAEKENRFIVPDGEDWYQAGRVLNLLQRIKKVQNKGKIPPISSNEAHRIIRDTLTARVCKRESIILITDNIGDFEKIRRFCKVKIVSGAEYFG